MRSILFLTGATALAAAAIALAPRPAAACGGFFCSQQPVDQQAERIVFAVNDDGTVTMVVQIAYQGDSENFAWVLPLGAVPDEESLDVFPQRALTALDAQTGPNFQWPDDPDCYGYYYGVEDAAAGGGPPPATREGDVTVDIRADVGPYDVAVIESDSPEALVSWLRDNGYRVTTAMEPYIDLYTAEGMPLLALRLQPTADVNDIQPFMFTMPGQSPTIPLRLTALAAEPEMGIAVFVLGDMRYGMAGEWRDVTVNDSEIVWRPYGYPLQTNWAALVARSVDAVAGKGFVTEFAGSTEPYLELVRATDPPDEEQRAAKDALLALMEGHPYITRLYTRLSPEEMTSDPSFRRVAGGDVDRTHILPRYVEGRDLCDIDWTTGPTDSTTPCDFASCGSAGLCRVAVVEGDGSTRDVAGCACAPGATARTTFDPSGQPIVSCIDQRLSFLNPGERAFPGEEPLGDPCVAFDCGLGGTCVSMNMTPTCVCDRGLVAVASVAPDGTRLTSCVSPTENVPDNFYDRRLPDLPIEGGRPVTVMPGVALGGGGACSVGQRGSAASLALLGLAGLFVLLRRRWS